MRSVTPRKTRGIAMISEANEDVTPNLARDLIDPTNVVAAMAAAVEHVRQLAKTVFKGDAALFEGSAEDQPT